MAGPPPQDEIENDQDNTGAYQEHREDPWQRPRNYDLGDRAQKPNHAAPRRRQPQPDRRYKVDGREKNHGRAARRAHVVEQRLRRQEDRTPLQKTLDNPKSRKQALEYNQEKPCAIVLAGDARRFAETDG